MAARQFPLELDETDDGILRSLAQELEAPQAQVLRWALRYYLLCGPVPDESEAIAESLIPRSMKVQVGPHHIRRLK